MDISQNRRQVARLVPGILAALALFLSALWAGPVFAGDPSALRLSDSEAALNLTPAQQQRLSVLESGSRVQSGQLIAQIRQLRQKLSEMYAAYSVDVAGARRANQDLNRVQGQLLDLRLSEQLQMRKILSPAQFAQLQEAIHKHDFVDEDRHHDSDDRHGHHRATSLN